MYARSTTVTTPADTVETNIARVRDEFFPQITAIDGCVGMSMLVDRDTGDCILTTAWRDELAMRASAAVVNPMRERAAQELGGSITDVQEWEVAVMHRDHRVGDGACCRTTWLRTDPTLVDRAIDIFRLGVLPQAEQMDGFCSASLLVDRTSGLASTTVTFDTRAAVEATRDRAASIRAGVAEEIGLEFLDIREFDVALAHLHVPEMV